jgi:predicted dehydrogenase
MNESSIDRRTFVGGVAGVVLAAVPLASQARQREEKEAQRIRVGVIGCGSVSHQYLPHLASSPLVELVSACDIIPERARAQAETYAIPNQYPHIDMLLAGAAFDLLVNLTDMQEHERLNLQAVAAGKHVWSEKPMANSLAAGERLLAAAKKKGVKVWGAPAMVVSSQFAFMAHTLNSGALGRVAAAHADYGHTGPDWAAFFYEKGGGSLPDLAVYNLTTLTGLLGPAKSVVAMTSVITPTRMIQGRGEIKVVAEDNAMVLLDHGEGVISHIQSGFNYFNPHGHDGSTEQRHTVAIVGTTGSLGLVGYDWEPLGVDLTTVNQPTVTRYATERGNFVWQMGATLAAESLATGAALLIDPQHALHVLEVIQAARESQDTGRRIRVRSSFRKPIVS